MERHENTFWSHVTGYLVKVSPIFAHFMLTAQYFHQTVSNLVCRPLAAQ